MSTSTTLVPDQTSSDIHKKVSWKIPITFAIGTLLLILMAMNAEGMATVRVNDSSQAIDIPDWHVNASLYLWIFVVIALAGTAWAFISAVLFGKYGRTGRILDRTAAVLTGFAVIAGFLLFAGAGSAGAITLTSTLVATVTISTPLVYGSLAGVLSERGGVVNIAIEGQLLVGAFVGVLVASRTQNAYLGLIAAPIAGMLLGSILALISVKYAVDQIIVGVVLNVLALGLTSFFYSSVMSGSGQALYNTNQFSLPRWRIPVLSEIPVLGPMLFNHTILVYIMYVVVIVLNIMLFKSRWGLRVRAVGEHPKAADTVGIKVNRTRIRNTLLASSIAGLGGAVFTIGSSLAFTSNISAGNGYIALAAMILGKWNPMGALGAAVMFGFAKAVAQLMPSLDGGIPSELVNMIPYLITIIAVAGFVGKSRPPAAENIPYVK